MGNDVKNLCSCNDEEKNHTKNEYTIVSNELIKNESSYNHNTVIEDKSKQDGTSLDFSKVLMVLKQLAKNKIASLYDTGINESESQRTLDCNNEEKDNILTDRRIIYKDKSEYIGTVLKGQRLGKGIFKGIDGLFYDGEWKNNIYDGFGMLIYNDKSNYTGNFKEGKKEGNGKYILGKVTYEGEFMNDMKEGEGNETYPDGSSYKGSYSNGMKSGIGMYFLITQANTH